MQNLALVALLILVGCKQGDGLILVSVGATPAVVNAVIDALARAGAGEAAEALQMPLTPEKLWRALRR